MKQDHNQARVRQLCRQLKPIIGKKADDVWLAYLAENQEGKDQLQEYLEIIAARHFMENLDQDQAVLVPPEAEQARGEYTLGDVVYNQQELFEFGLREDEWVQHVGIFGRSGGGKTNLGLLITKKLLKRGKPFLVFDWKRNYRDLLTTEGYEDVAVYTIGRSVMPFSFNPLIPPPQTNPTTWLKKIIDVIAHAYMLGNGVIYMLQEAIDSAYREAGVYDGSVEKWPTFKDIYQRLKQKQSAGREAGWLSSALRAMASLCFGEMDRLVNQRSADSQNIQKLLARPAILELDALTQSDKVLFVSALLLWIHHFRMTESDREIFKHAIIIEEAHHILSNERRSLLGGQSVMEITFREIREFGESLIILDQHPSQISMPALGNTYCTVCFNLKHKTDVNAISQAMFLKDQQKDVVGNLPIGQAVVRLQGRINGPFVVKVPEFNLKKGSLSDAGLITHMTRLGLYSERKHAPHLNYQPPGPAGAADIHASSASTSNNPSPDRESKSAMPSLREKFLKDVSELPESGIAARYKRLGISVRQGQKIKDLCVQKGLIREHREITNKGRRKVIRLTEKGALALSKEDIRMEDR